MLRKIYQISMALAIGLSGGALASAEDLVIDGLGRMPMAQEITVVDGGKTKINEFMVQSVHQKDYGKSVKASLWSILTVPPGMNLYPEKPPYPYDSMHMYQMRKKDVRGVYSAGVFVIKGSAEDFFHGGNRKAADFWKDAFREDAERPTSLFGMPKIRTEELQALVDHVLAEKKGPSLSVKILTFTPWRAYKNEDGTFRWSQEAKVVMTNEKGLSFPLWISSSLLKQGDTYYLIEINGSHIAADKMADDILYGFYRMKR